MIPDDPQSFRYRRIGMDQDHKTMLQMMEEPTCLGEALGIPDRPVARSAYTPSTRKRPDPGWAWYRAQSTLFGDPEWPRSTPEKR
jgi:hypothetical protein